LVVEQVAGSIRSTSGQDINSGKLCGSDPTAEAKATMIKLRKRPRSISIVAEMSAPSVGSAFDF
jgi:hypothetical protein